MNACGGVDVWLHVFLTLALVGGEWSASGPGRFSPRGKRPQYPMDRRLGMPQKPVSMMWRRENSWPYWDSNSSPSVVQPAPSCQLTVLSQLPFWENKCYKFIYI
jgi:hypothetical protein